MDRIFAATANPGKLAEMRRILAGGPFEIVGMDGIEGWEPPEETGQSYRENARLKALAGVRLVRQPCFADDSGLEVDALGGEPAIRSARFGGTADERNRKLLTMLAGVPHGLRSARFRAVVVLLVPDGRGLEEHCFEGVLEGSIADEPSGSSGFGYDPVFLVPGLGLTVASLPPGLKDEVSHRGQALRAMAEFLRLRMGT